MKIGSSDWGTFTPLEEILLALFLCVALLFAVIVVCSLGMDSIQDARPSAPSFSDS